MSMRHLWKLSLPLIVGLVTVAAVVPRPAAAQSPQPQAVVICPAPEAPNGVEVCVDRGEGAVYFEGDPIRICVTVNIPQILIFPPPPPPLVRVTASVNTGPAARIIFEEYFAHGQRCIDGTIAAPFGIETITAEVIARDGRVIASDSTYFFSAPRTQPPQNASIGVDRGPGAVYRLGDGIRICYAPPAPGSVTIVDLLPDGRQQVLLSGQDDGTGGCFNAVITPPTGTECLRLDYWTSAGSGSTQVCFQVAGDAPPPGAAFISTDRFQYRLGDSIRICYDVPGPGPITITSLLPNGGSRVLLSGYEDGTGACFTRALGPEVGVKCLRLDFTTSGVGGTRRTCFRVTA